MQSMLCIVIAVALTASQTRGEEKHWSYDDADPATYGPSAWTQVSTVCGVSKTQSPVDITTRSAVSGFRYNKIRYSGYDTALPGVSFTATNNGHTVHVEVNSHAATVEDGGLMGKYVLEQFHFHWGPDNTHGGSEHKVDGHSFPVEIHLVHHREQYGSVSEALASNDPDAVAVLGIFGKVAADKDVDKNLLQFVNKLDAIVGTGAQTYVDSFPLNSFLPRNTQYYRYHGSLTTPPCTAKVVWTVFSDPINISTSMLDKLRSLDESDTEKILHNYRPIQDLGDRTLHVGG